MKISRILLLLFLCAVLLLAQATYQGVHNYSVVSQSAIPTMGGQFSTVVDNDFGIPGGVTIMRITTGNTCVGSDTSQQNKSYVGFSGSEDYAFNSDSTMFTTVCSSANATVFVINPLTFPAAGSVTPLSTRTNSNDTAKNCFAMAGQSTAHGIGFGFAPGSGQWSSINPHIIYGADTSDNINSLDVITGTTTHLIAGSVLVAAGFTGAGDVNEFSIGRNGDNSFCWTGGSNLAQGNAFLVGYATTGATPWTSPATLTHVLNSLTNTIDGSPFAAGSATISDKLHNSRIQPEGRYVAIATFGGLLYIWDTTTGMVTLAGTRQTQGHRTFIYGNQLVNQDGSLPQVANPAPTFDLWSALTPNGSITALLNPQDPSWISGGYGSYSTNYDTHPAGQFSSLSIPLQPLMMAADQVLSTSPVPGVMPLGGEIYSVHANGTGVDRITWTRRTQTWTTATACNAAGHFECVTGIQVSPNGQWMIIPSNWGQHNCVGTPPSVTGCDLGVDISGYPQIAIFLVKLPLLGNNSFNITGRTKFSGKIKIQ